MKFSNPLTQSETRLVKRALVLWTAFAAVMTFCGWAAMSITRLRQPVIIPKVVAMEEKEAERALRSKGLLMETAKPVHDERVPAGSIVIQIPRANNYAKRGDKVRVSLSLGKPRRKVPNVVNQNVRRAQNLLAQSQFRIGRRSTMSSPVVAKDTVMAQVPLPGEVADSADPVNLLISTGPSEPAFMMPDVRQLPLDRVIHLFRTAGMMIEKITTKVEDDVTPGTVLSQNPKPGAKLVENAPISLTVSTTSTEAAVQARLSVFTYFMPEGPPRRLRIDVLDNTGARTVYNKMEEAGNEVRLELKVTGKAVMQVYLNQVFEREYTLE